jgi:hypothetical protein
MNQESGRSLVEIIGVMAIGAVLLAGAVAAYNSIRARTSRTIATATLEEIAKNTKLLLEVGGDYSTVSIDYLIKSGALKNSNQPIGAPEWSITSSADGYSFAINLTGLTRGECEYFTTINMDWAVGVSVNGFAEDPATYCISGDNEISFIVE